MAKAEMELQVRMKGITCCGDCIYYSMKRHRCTRGAKDYPDARESFYRDCPLPEFDPGTIAKMEELNRDQFARIQELEAKIKAYQAMKGEMK